MRHRFTKVMLAAALFMLLAGTATVAARSEHATAGYKIGFIYPRTGLLAAYGAEEIQGFKLGLQYATKGTMKVNGKTLDITYVDDKGDAATGVTTAKDLIGQGYKILMGTGSEVELAMEAEGTFVAMNNRVSQSVPHLHVHVVPRRRKDGLKGFFWPRTKYSDQQQLNEVQSRLRSVINELKNREQIN